MLQVLNKCKNVRIFPFQPYFALFYLEKVATKNLIPPNPTITLVFLLKNKTGLLSVIFFVFEPLKFSVFQESQFQLHKNIV